MNDFWTWVRFAWHNCLRNLRRSLVTTAIAMLGTAAILLAGGFALFTYDSLAQASARDTGHLVLGTPAHFAQDEDVPLQNGLDAVDALRGTLLALNVGVIVPFIEGIFGLHFISKEIYQISAVPSVTRNAGRESTLPSISILLASICAWVKLVSRLIPGSPRCRPSRRYRGPTGGGNR